MSDTIYICGVNKFRDGGTLEIITTEGTYIKDNAIGSTTKGKWFHKLKHNHRERVLIEDRDLSSKLSMLSVAFANTLLK